MLGSYVLYESWLKKKVQGVVKIVYNGGSGFRQMGHWSRDRIHLSIQPVWKTCWHGVTTYRRRARIKPADETSRFDEAINSLRGTRTSSTGIMQMAQSTLGRFTPVGFSSSSTFCFLPVLGLLVVLVGTCCCPEVLIRFCKSDSSSPSLL